jgi:hypothetical protein
MSFMPTLALSADAQLRQSSSYQVYACACVKPATA